MYAQTLLVIQSQAQKKTNASVPYLVAIFMIQWPLKSKQYFVYYKYVNVFSMISVYCVF